MTQVLKQISIEEFNRLFPDADFILEYAGQEKVKVLLEITPLAYEQYNPKTKKNEVITYNGT